MKCPVCEIDLIMSERQGIEIDYCSKCRGVWLDRGELDKIIEKSNADDGRVAHTEEHKKEHHEPGTLDQKNYYNEKDYRKKKRGNFLGDIFDFGD